MRRSGDPGSNTLTKRQLVGCVSELGNVTQTLPKSIGLTLIPTLISRLQLLLSRGEADAEEDTKHLQAHVELPTLTQDLALQVRPESTNQNFY